MIFFKLTAITSAVAIVLSVLAEGLFSLSARPYLFGFPRTKWPLIVTMLIVWAVGARCAYYLVVERGLTFYGSSK